MHRNTLNRPADSHVSHLECSLTGARFPHDRLRGLSPERAPLLVRYDLPALRQRMRKDEVLAAPPNMWRWRPLLPLDADTMPVTLGEWETPLIPLTGSRGVGRSALYIKDEGRLPTGSFKARGMSLAVTMARYFGKTVLAVPTAGNAGAAAAAYGAAAGFQVHVFTPEDTPEITLREMAFHGAAVIRVRGLIDACGLLVRRAAAEHGWHDLSTLAEPYRIEGKKTMGLELAAQFGWRLPDVIYYPTGGGTGFIGMWKAFRELQELGWLDKRLPRMVTVQAEGCNPIKAAWEAKLDDVAEAWSPVTTTIPGVRVPKPLGGRLILEVIRASNGAARSVTDAQAFAARDEVAARGGVNLCPEGAACYAAYRNDLEAGRVSDRDVVVVFNTATGLKWPMPPGDSERDCRHTTTIPEV